MTVFYCRVPFVVEVNANPLQIATKVELFIWNLGATEPTIPTHIVEKPIFSPTQYIGKYNISPFVADVITPTNRVVNCKIKTYYKLVTDWVLEDTFDYLGSYGYKGGLFADIDWVFLEGPTDNRFFYNDFWNFDYSKLTLDVMWDFDVYNTLRVKYESELGSEIVDYTDTGIKLLTIPKTISNDFFVNGNIIKLQVLISGEWYNLYVQQLTAECENKYLPYVLTYTNMWGGHSQITLFKKSTFSNDFKGSDYNLEGRKKVFNVNGTRSVKLNTGWISQNTVKALKDMMLSEYISLSAIDGSEVFEATIKTTSFIEKTNLNDKVINYEIDFEVATPLIQNYV